jgi:hypothetical protein
MSKLHIAKYSHHWLYKTGMTVCGKRVPVDLLTADERHAECEHCRAIFRSKNAVLEALRREPNLADISEATLAVCEDASRVHEAHWKGRQK